MNEVTLESLAKRVEELERRAGVLPPGLVAPEPRYTVRPGKGSVAEALKALDEITDYDFEAVCGSDAPKGRPE